MAKQAAEAPEQPGPEQQQEAVAARSRGAAAQHAWRNIRLIVGREYKNRVTQRSFATSTIILLVMVAIAGFVPTIIRLVSSRIHPQTQMAVVNEAGPIAGMSESALVSTISTDLNGANAASPAPYAVRSAPQSDLGSLEEQLKTGQLDILLVFGRAASGELSAAYTAHGSSTNDSNLPGIQVLAQRLAFLDTARRLGLTPAQTGRLSAPPDLSVVRPQSTRSTSQLIAGATLAFAGGILMYVTVLGYASIIASGVAEEKGSRVMELLLNAATPFQLLAGKILGIGTACLTQIGALVVVGLVAIVIQTPLQTALFGPQGQGFIQYLTAVSVPFYLAFLLYFALDFFMYATVYAGLASMVRGPDEVRSAIMVPMLLVIAGWASVYLGVYLPDSTVVRVLSYVPIFAPELMLARLALGTVAWWEIVVTAVLMLGTIAFGAWFAARLYRYGVLMYGQKPGLGQALRLVRTRP